MLNIPRVNLNGSLSTGDNVLQVCALQTRLYTESIWGSYNSFGVKISKLILNLKLLFPVMIEDLSLELITIKAFSLSQIVSEFVFEFRVIRYFKFNDIVSIDWFMDVEYPLFKLPKLLKYGMIYIGNVQKILISQFVSSQEIKVNGNCISLLTTSADYLHIKVNGFKLDIECFERRSDYVLLMFALGVKVSCLLKNFVCAVKIVYYKNKWYVYSYKPLFICRVIYGFKRIVRREKVIIEPFVSNRCVVLDIVLNNNNNVINIGDIIVLSLTTALYFSNVLYVSAICGLSKTIKALVVFYNNGVSCCCNDVTIADISSVNITQVGRYLINSLICSYFCDSDLLTKGDLITIWCKVVISKVVFDKVNVDVQMVKSVGDMIIETVSMFLKTLDLTKVVKGCLLNNVFMIDNLLQMEIDKLLNTSSLCQYSEQLNSLSLLSHRNRLTSIGVVGLSSQTSEIAVRDVHQWYFGKICPIESPEGQTIGLIAALSLYANIDVNGCISTAYYKLYQGCVTNDIVYLNSYEIERYCVSLLNNNYFFNNVLCLNKNEFKVVNGESVVLRIISPVQVFSCVVNLIPFLNHNDPVRALMAANMQKQAIPLLTPQSPLVGTGLEYYVMKATDDNISAREMSVVINVDAVKIIVYEIIRKSYKVYLLPQPSKSNQGLCLKLRSVVDPYQIVCRDEILAECQSSDNGEMSLGANLSVAFMCWDGFNYEDSILMSSAVVEKGILDSLHIMDLEVKVVKTLFGTDLLTNELKSIAFKCYKRLPKNGIITIGSLVCEGDVLVGKLSPVISNSLDKANWNVNKNQFKVHMVDSSLRVPEGISSAFVLEVLRETQILEDDGSYNFYILGYNIVTKTYIRRCSVLLEYSDINDIVSFKYNSECVSSVLLNKSVKDALDLVYKCYILRLQELQRFLFEGFNARLTNGNSFDKQVFEVIKVKLLIRKSIRTGDKICGRHGNKGIISKIVPKQDMPFMADGTPVDIVLNPLGVPSRMNIGQILEANFGLISYKLGMEFKYILKMYECHKDKELVLKMAVSKLFEMYPNIQVYSIELIIKILQNLSKGVKISCPLFGSSVNELINKLNKRLSFKCYNGQYQLYDGRTGLPFNRKSTVGVIYVFKLNHLIDNKMHARSTGPYSVITQQPLKGKAYKGGQRLGEMEIWALQGYGSAYFIKEALTAKCDDIISREILNESLLYGLPVLTAFWGEGLLLLLKELFAICVNVEIK